MTNGPLDSLPALEMRLWRQVANYCQKLEPTITRKRGRRGYTGTKHSAGLMARSAFQHFDIFHLLHRTKQPTIFTNL